RREETRRCDALGDERRAAQTEEARGGRTARTAEPDQERDRKARKHHHGSARGAEQDRGCARGSGSVRSTGEDTPPGAATNTSAPQAPALGDGGCMAGGE